MTIYDYECRESGHLRGWSQCGHAILKWGAEGKARSVRIECSVNNAAAIVANYSETSDEA